MLGLGPMSGCSLSGLPVVGVAGPSGPGTGTSDSSSAGTVPWVNPGNVTADDGSFATSAAIFVAMPINSYYLDATNFGFAVPSGAVIWGVAGQFKRQSTISVGITDNLVVLVKGGTPGGTNHAAAGNWPTSEAFAGYGGFIDLWGQTLSSGDVNSSGFGIAISSAATATGTAEIDYATLAVYYVLAAPGAAPLVSVTDSLTLSDIFTPLEISFVSKTDTLTLADSLSPALGNLVSVVDSLALSDFPTVLEVSLLSVADSLTLTDSFSPLVVSFIDKTDTLTFAEVVVGGAEYAFIITDSLVLSDVVNPLLVNFASVVDGLTLTDFFSGTGIISFIITDSLTLTDALRVFLYYPLSVSDTIFLSENDTLVVVVEPSFPICPGPHHRPDTDCDRHPRPDMGGSFPGRPDMSQGAHSRPPLCPDEE